MRVTIVLLTLLILSSCSSKSTCTTVPGADINISKGEKVTEKITPKATISCNF